MKRKYYKAFDSDMKCNNKQYKENTIYEEEGNRICSKGVMHFCPTPLDTLDYYLVSDAHGRLARWAEIKPLSRILSKGNKRASNAIEVLSEISFKDFIKESIKVIKEKVSQHKSGFVYKDSDNLEVNSNHVQIASDVENANIVCCKDNCKIAAINSKRINIYGNRNIACLDSDNCTDVFIEDGGGNQINSLGDHTFVFDNGDANKIHLIGNCSVVFSNGISSKLILDGEKSKACLTHAYSKIILNGKKSIGCSLGYMGFVRGKIGDWIILTEWDKEGNPNIVSFKIDGHKYKEDTFYYLNNGNIEIAH